MGAFPFVAGAVSLWRRDDDLLSSCAVAQSITRSLVVPLDQQVGRFVGVRPSIDFLARADRSNKPLAGRRVGEIQENVSQLLSNRVIVCGGTIPPGLGPEG